MRERSVLLIKKTPVNMTLMSEFHFSKGNDSNGARYWSPALLTNTSIAPFSLTMSVTTDLITSSLVTSK